MKRTHQTAGAWFVLALTASTLPAPAAVRPWEKQELTFTSARPWANPYTDVTVFVDLTGPNFKKRIYGFWDGGPSFRVRLVATAPGTWTWRSGSNPPDEGLAGKTGSFAAVDWTEAEKLTKPRRRGFVSFSASVQSTAAKDPVFPARPSSGGLEPLRQVQVPGAVATRRTRNEGPPSQNR